MQLVEGLGILLLLGLSSAVTPEEQEESTNDFPLLMPHTKPESPESYLCTPVRLSTEETYYVVGFKPKAEMRTAHHILVFGCEEPGSDDEVWQCGEMSSDKPGSNIHRPCATTSNIIYAWAMDAPPLQLPEDVGFRVGAGTDIKYLVLQVHYNSIDHIPSTGDQSGVILQYTDKVQPKSAGVLLLGTGGFAPPRSTTYFETSCEITDPRPIHPFAFRTHTHSLGKVVSGWRVRDRKHWTLIGKKSPQLPQMFYPVLGDVSLRQGDHVAARCTMVNNRDRPTYIGVTNKDEMCNFYMMYWVSGTEPVYPNSCFTKGPPSWSWGGFMQGGLKNIPDVEASTL